MRPAWAAAAAVVGLLACHEEGSGCHWPWNKGDDDDVTAGTAEYGEACEESGDCVTGLTCAGDGVCRTPGEPGTFGAGDPCASSEYCALGLVCSSAGECAEPGDPGTATLGDECTDTTDCELGLFCEQDACYGLPLPLWLGEECEVDSGAFRVYFEVPAGAPIHDFYRLPFPNDARVRDDGTLDLTGHPTPGALIPALGDVVGTVFELLEEDFTGFGNNEAVFFRFSQHFDYDGLVRGHPHEGGTWGIVDLTAGPDYGTQAGGGYATATSRGQYICPNWFAIAPIVGRPFQPGHVYAAYVSSALVRDSDGAAITQDPDFAALLGATAPADTRLTRAWNAYEPLRDWIAAVDGLDNEDFAAATVFTVQDPEAPMLLLREAALAATPPVESGLHLCTAVGGPYADADDPDRGCSDVDPGFYEIQGLVSLPQFQAGTPPFKNPDDGGTIDLSGDAPAVARTDQVHFTLTIPKGATMPINGWPLVLYGHGTGGNYTSAVREGLADELSDVTLDDSTHERFATLTIDAPMHGPRRHEENWDEAWLAIDPGAYDADVLYFNPINPRAARDNALQAAADDISLLRWAQTLYWAPGTSPTGSAISFDDGEMFYLGHSQGSTAGVGFVAYEPGISAAVFSGAGGLLIESLANKTLPYDMAAAIAIGLADPDIDRYHPVLNLVQGAAERSDGINHAPHVQYDPLNGDPPRHVFQTFGVGDHYTPDETQEALVRALRISQVPNGFTPLGGVAQTSLPATGNLTGTTGVAVLYGPSGSNDAHYVLFDRPEAMRAMTHFFGTAVRDGTPTVVAPSP